ncbi:hypothetical protein ACFQ2B_29055 [Streptomyces stramineus]
MGLAAAVNLYRLQGERALNAELAARHAPTGPWTTSVVGDPEHATALLRQHTSLSGPEAGEVYGQVFSHGMQAAMWMVAGTSLAALAVLGLLGLSARRSTPAAREVAADNEPAR